jgi:hypothetical protein
MRQFGISIAASLLAVALSGGNLARAQTTVFVPATTAWFDTGVDVAAGQRLLIIASGQWSKGGAQPLTVGSDGWANVSVAGLIAPRLHSQHWLGASAGGRFWSVRVIRTVPRPLGAYVSP